MRIAYIAIHGRKDNDDEGAISYALESLGHQVHKQYEGTDYRDITPDKFDLVLFHHHWKKVALLQKIKIPKVFWFFDLVHHPQTPNRHVSHLKKLTDIADLGFCTDGYWAKQSPKVYHLMQGADKRVMGQYALRDSVDILFAGSVQLLSPRIAELEELRRIYQRQLRIHTRKNEWVYREALGKLVGKSKIVIALKFPTKDNYWSNRVYLIGGFGGFLIHPYCEQLLAHYEENKEIVYYNNLRELRAKINYYLKHKKERDQIRANMLKRTLAEHTYTHRCETLLKIVEERLL